MPQQPQLGMSLPEVCHVCQARFRDVMELIAHSEAAHSNNNNSNNNYQAAQEESKSASAFSFGNSMGQP